MEAVSLLLEHTCRTLFKGWWH